VALLYFEKRLGGVRLSPIQSSLLLGMGLQRKSVEEVEVRWCSSSSYLNLSSDPSTGRTPATCITSTRTFREAYP
jgi:Possible tRNA binding domain